MTIRQEKQTKMATSVTLSARNIAIGLLLLVLPSRIDAISLRTTTRILGNKSAEYVQRFLSTPSNWPDIVLSSWSVEAGSKSSRSTRMYDTRQPMKVGDTVDEIFGLPPILPLSVSWTCVEEKPGRLDMRAPNGLSGIASNCRMLFDISPSRERNIEAVQVDLTMEYEPENILAQLALPILIVDNAIALKVLLPYALERQANHNPLNDFRKLMGSLYGIAGIAHLLDCLAGPSALLVMAGSPPFYELPWQGQLLALWWCVTGPLAFGLSWTRFADLGLLVYGATEVTCAAITAATSGGDMDAFFNVILLQAIVAASWFYSSRRSVQKVKE